jgi:hypothetical protein
MSELEWAHELVEGKRRRLRSAPSARVELELGDVEAARSARALERARLGYRASLVEAVGVLEAAGARDAFAQTARAAGVSRQAVRQLLG